MCHTYMYSLVHEDPWYTRHVIYLWIDMYHMILTTMVKLIRQGMTYLSSIWG